MAAVDAKDDAIILSGDAALLTGEATFTGDGDLARRGDGLFV